MADPKPLTFLLSDESVNSYGTRILTAGIDLSLFKSNPIMLWNHFRTWAGKTDEVLPIGRWENIRKEGEQLLADAVFDDKDPFAQKIKAKVEQGIINMASIGINVIVTSEDPAVLVKGQTRPTVIKSLINEASICDIASNRNALRLYDEFDAEINLSAGGQCHLLPLLSDQKPNKKPMNLREIATAVGLKETDDQDVVLSAVQAMATQNTELKERVKTFETAEKTLKAEKITTLLNDAIKDRKFLEADRPTYQKLAEADYEAASKAIANLSVVQDLSASADPDGKTPKKLSAWDLKLKETGQID